MTNDELIQLIKQVCPNARTPSNQELEIVKQKLLYLKRWHGKFSKNDLKKILFDVLHDSYIYILESVDMSDSISIIDDIIAKINDKL